MLGVSASRAASIAAEYPVAAYPSPAVAFSTLDDDAWWACPAIQIDHWLARHVPTFAYAFNDDNAVARYFPTPGVATHTSELPYIFDLPNAPIQQPFSPDQEALATAMRAAWASFATSGDPSTNAVAWPTFESTHVLSLVPPQPTLETSFASTHHCSFWAADD